METQCEETIDQTGLELKTYVDSQLKERDLLYEDYSITSLDNEGVVTSILDARQRDFWDSRDVEVNYEVAMKEIKEIQIGNKQIEEKVKMELMGLDSNPFKRFVYQVINFFRGFGNNIPETAQDIMKAQLDRVDEVSLALRWASLSIDEKVDRLDTHYDKLTKKLEKGASYRMVLLEKIEKTRDFMENTKEVLDESEDFSEKLKYNAAIKKLRRGLQAQTWKLKMLNNEILDTKKEIPFIDNLGDFCQTYSFALKESYQKVQAVKNHLANIMGLYFEMMKSNNISDALKESLETLTEYTSNMTKSLFRAQDLVVKINNDERFTNEYSDKTQKLEEMVDNVFDSNFDSLNQLEAKVQGFLGKERF